MPDLNVTQQRIQAQEDEPAGSESEHILQSTMRSTPGPERCIYLNKESAKVNSGLCFASGSPTNVANAFGTNNYHISLPAPLPMPAASFKPKPTVGQLVRRLLHPPPHAFVHGVLSIQWVMGAIGADEFDFRSSDERYVLTQTSPIRRLGLALGIPRLLLEWLCGDEKFVTPSEQNVCLTPGFFDELGRSNAFSVDR